MSGPSVISVDSSPASPATPLDAGVPVNQPCEPEPRSRSRSPSIDPTLAQLSPVNPRDYSRASPAPAPHSPAPSLVPAPPSPTLWWTEAEVPALPASPHSPLLWWTEPVGVPPPPPWLALAFVRFRPTRRQRRRPDVRPYTYPVFRHAVLHPSSHRRKHCRS